jgi:type I restriction enzyme S subunit
MHSHAAPDKVVKVELCYRTRLTADIVTGKPDVREASTQLLALPTDTAPEPVVDDTLDETGRLDDAEAKEI